MTDEATQRPDQPRRSKGAGNSVILLLLAAGLAICPWFLIPAGDAIIFSFLIGVVTAGVAGGVTGWKGRKSELERPKLKVAMSVVSVFSWMVALAAAALMLAILAFCSSYWPGSWCGVPEPSEAVYPSDASVRMVVG